MAETAQERTLRYLTDALAAEEGGLSSLKDIAAEATDADVKSAVTEHIAQTQSQVDRLESRITTLGGTKNSGKSFINTVIGKGSDLLNVFHDSEDKQTQDIIKAYALEHFEVGAYTSLVAYATAVGDTETATLAKTILQEEKTAGEKLLGLIPQVAVQAVNKTASTA